MDTKAQAHTYVKERIGSIHETEKKLVSFLDNFAELLEKMHSVQSVVDEAEQSKAGGEEEIKGLINECYDDISFASVHLRRELKLLDAKLPLPPNVSKKASDVNNDKLKHLLQ